MKRTAVILCLAAIVSAPLFAQSVDPCSQTTKLSATAAGAQTFTSNTQGNSPLGGSGNTAYGYEMWTEGGNSNKLIWYGPNQGGGMAYRAEWANPNDYLARIGYYWGDEGSTYSTYKNIYADFNHTRSGRSTAGDYSYIGIYGWSKNPSATNANERLIEYYIVEDWFGNQWSDDDGPMDNNTTQGTIIGNFRVDGATYDIHKSLRENAPSVAGTQTFTQIFSIRRSLRKCGSISVMDHYKKWEELGLTMGNLYEAKFLAEAGGGEGWFELSYLKMSQEDSPREVIDNGNACEYESSFCGDLEFADVKDNSTAAPGTGVCLFIENFEIIQPTLSSTVSINGKSNTCGSDWSDCSYNSRPSPKDDGYYVYVQEGTINAPDGWKNVVAKAKPSVCSNTGTSSSSSDDGNSSSSDDGNSSSSDGTDPIRMLSSIPGAAFQVRAMSDGSLLIDANSPTTVEIYNLKGNKVAKFNVLRGSQKVNLSLPNGMYFAKARGAKVTKFMLK
jgi:endo-1,4-beta-xylanase